MIFESLYRFGKTIPKVKRFFTEETVHFVLDINTRGNINSFLFNGIYDKEKKRYFYTDFKVPLVISKRTSGESAQYIFDNLMYLLGFFEIDKGPRGATVTEKNKKRAITAFDKYTEMLQGVRKRTGLKEVGYLLKCREKVLNNPEILLGSLQSENTKIMGHISGKDVEFPSHINKSMWVLPRINGKSLFDFTEIQRDFIMECERVEDDDEIVEDIYSGKKMPLAKNHPPLRIRGAENSGVPLISNNDSSFFSFGLSGNQNVPITKESAIIIAAAVKQLLSNDNNHYLAKSGDTILFWTGDKGLDVDLMQTVSGESPETVKRVLSEPYLGSLINPMGVFTSIILRGYKGRVAFKDFSITLVKDVITNIKIHYEDIGTDFEKPLGILQFIRPEKKAEFFQYEIELYNACILGTMYPRGLLDRLLDWCMIGNSCYRTVSRLERTLAYGKGYLNRGIRLGLINNRNRLEASLDEKNSSYPYLLGRLLAVMEKLRDEASVGGDNKASLLDKMLSAFLSTPSIAYVSTYNMSVHHLTKLKAISPAKASWIQSLMIEIQIRLPERTPKTFKNIEDKTEFIAGYTQQYASFFKKEEEKTLIQE